MPSSIYIAGRFESRGRLLSVKGILVRAGHVVLSTWLDEPPEREYWTVAGTKAVLRDLHEIAIARYFLLDTLDRDDHGGREAEFGVALARGKHIWIIGPYRNVFHSLAEATFETWDEAIDAINQQGLEE